MSYYVRENLYRRALGMKNRRRIEFELAAAAGVCAPLSPVYDLYILSADSLKVASAFDLPPELCLPIPEELPSGS